MNALLLRFLKETQNKGRLKYYENHSLSLVSTFGIGGRARVFVTPFDTKTLCSAVRIASLSGRAVVIGNASNLLFDDYGFDETVISTVKLKKLEVLISPPEIKAATGEKVVLYAECGVMLPLLSAFAAREGISGFEGLCSIPATVGGAVCLNAGAYGTEISDNLLAYEVYSRKNSRIRLAIAEKNSFSYRKSPINSSAETVLGAYFRMPPGEKNEIEDKVRRSKACRAASQPIGARCAGSYFKRPIVSDLKSPFWGKSAGEIIDLCGLKGLSVGGAQVSCKHANFIINSNGRATACDVLSLAEKVKKEVLEKTGVRLCEEVEYIPFLSEYRTHKR